MGECMGGCIEGYMGGFMGGCIGGCMGGCMGGCTGGCMGGGMEGCMGGAWEGVRRRTEARRGELDEQRSASSDHKRLIPYLSRGSVEYLPLPQLSMHGNYVKTLPKLASS